jgi:CheY-like chemotaxis protein
MPVDEVRASRSSTPRPKISGRVLFADDALDNRRLVDHLLRKAGADPILVEDGQQAIDAALHGAFDLILLDVQMPNVDGLSAARAMRQAGIRTPIVSLSAGAMTSDVLKAIEAGCSMHLAKPFSRESFYEMLKKFLDGETQSELPSSVVVSHKLSDDAEMNELLVEFIDTLTPRLHELRSAWQGTDWAKLEALAHKLRGSAGLYGYPHLSALGETLEQQAKKGDEAAADTLLEVAREVERVVAGREYTIHGGVAHAP